MRNEQTTSTVILNGEQAQNELGILGKRADDLRKRLVELNNQSIGKTGKELEAINKEYARKERELKQADKAVRQFKKSNFELDKVLRNLSGSTLRDLTKAERQIQAEMNKPHVRRGSKEWNEYRKQIQDVRRAKRELHNEMKAGESRWTRFAGFMNKSWGSITAGLAAITGLSFALRRSALEAARMSDVYSDVMKTTGLTAEQVAELNVQFKRMNTRTARDQLNLLAYEAGKLGLSAQEDILGFVKAADVLKIAMGDVLGDGAALQIGKMVGVYERSTRHLQTLDLEGRMLSLGAAVNELGKTSTANEQYMINFAGRLGGIAVQAGLGIDQILGFASALDQDMQKVEMSATAFQKMVMNMFRNTEAFARAANIPLQEFTELMRNDMNAAILAVLRGFSGKDGLEQLIPEFREMGLAGARASSAISSMANSIERIEEAQRIANQAMIEGTSALEEFEIKNNNMQAQLERARKAFFDASETLGKSLSPVLLKSTKLTTHLIRALAGMPEWLRENKGLVIALAAAWGVYAIAVMKSTAVKLKDLALDKTKIAVKGTKRIAILALSFAYNTLTGNVVRAARAKKGLKLAMKAIPFGAILAAASALAVGIYKLATRTNSVRQAVKEFNKETIKQERELRSIFAAYKRANEGTAERERLLQLILQKYGPYIQDLIDEYGRITDIEEAQLRANTALREGIALRIQNTKINEIQKREVERQARAFSTIHQQVYSAHGAFAANEAVAKIRQIYQENEDNLRKAAAESRRLLKETYGVGSSTARAVLDFLNVTPTHPIDAAISQLNASLRRTERETKAVKAGFAGITTSAGEATEVVFGDDSILTITPPTIMPEAEVGEADFRASLAALERQAKVFELTLVEAFRLQQLHEEMYRKLSEENQVEHLRRKIALQQQYGEDSIATEIQLSNALIRQQQNRERAMEARQRELQRLGDFEIPPIVEEEADISSITDSFSLETRFALLQEFHRLGIKSEQEYQEALAALIRENRDEINRYIRDADLQNNQQRFEDGYIGEKEFIENLRRIHQAYWEERFAREMDLAEQISAFAMQTTNFVSSLQNAQLLAVENRHAAELRAARGNAQKTLEIQERIEEEKKAIRKRYADIEFVITVGKIIAETARAVMAAAPLVPLMIATGVAGAAQVAVANQQRQRVKNLWTGGYAGGGFTPNVGKYTPTAIVHGNEFIGSTASVQNPTVRKVYDLVDHAQKTNTIARINPEAVAQAIGIRRSLASGGFASDAPPVPASGQSFSELDIVEMRNALKQSAAINAALLKQLKNGIFAYATISGRDGIKNAMDNYNTMTNNAKRG